MQHAAVFFGMISREKFDGIKTSFSHRAESLAYSKTVDLDIFLINTQLFLDKIGDFGTLITLQLDDFAEVLILYDCTIGSKVLLEGFQNTFRVIFFWKPLDSGQCLTTVTLLDSNMNIVLRLLAIPTGVCERIEAFEIVEGHKPLLFLGISLKKVFEVRFFGGFESSKVTKSRF